MSKKTTRTRTPLYHTWKSMRGRCNCPSFRQYPRYGGRGIKVCKRWSFFKNFLEDMGNKPSSEHSLDRIDNDGPYSPENCRWATRAEQTRNRSTNRILTYKGKNWVMTDLAAEHNMTFETLGLRMKRWGADNLEKCLTTPMKLIHKQKQITINGVTKGQTEWCIELKMTLATFKRSLASGKLNRLYL